jgi:peptidyl-prolyl cis-trans isomerase B (cyclophilin B)
MGIEKRARQKENRQQRLAAESRAATAAKWRRRLVRWPILLGLVALAFWLPTRGDDTEVAVTDDSAAPLNAPASYDEFRSQVSACGSDQPDERTEMTFEEPGDADVEGLVTLTLETSCGEIVLTLDADAAPETVNSFVFLAEEGYFDGTVCHRLVPGFVLQCGDPSATGTGDPGYIVPDEFPDAGFVYTEGVLAMANSGSGTTGSQFFLVIGDASFLDPVYSVFGTFEDTTGVIAAMLDIPLGLSSGAQSGPLETIYLTSVTVDG